MISPIKYYDFAPLDLMVICGGVRCYKTLELVRIMHVAYSMGYRVITNLTLSRLVFPNYIQLSKTSSNDFLKGLRDIMAKRSMEKDYSPMFLGIDEFSSIADAVNWKANNKDADIWKQLGKVGITTACTNQAFSMTYNRYRDNANILKITKRINDSYYLLNVMEQSRIDHETYNPILSDMVIDARDYFTMYDTHELMYV